MQFGLNFFPCVEPAEKSAEQYFREAIHLASLTDELGYTHVRQVEHYFKPYGGYSPNPLIFLTAVAQRTRKVRLITGAVLPAFNSPLKLAGEIGMLDGISAGRLEVGFARAFLPHEFAQFGVSLDESRRRFTEGLAQITLLLAEEDVSSKGEFHSFANVTSLPRPTQCPHPPFWIAATNTPETFAFAGKLGCKVMAIPLEPEKMRSLIGTYRQAWRAANHPGNGHVMNTFFMYCAPTREEAMATGLVPCNGHLQGLAAAAKEWLTGASTKELPGLRQVDRARHQRHRRTPSGDRLGLHRHAGRHRGYDPSVQRQSRRHRQRVAALRTVEHAGQCGRAFTAAVRSGSNAEACNALNRCVRKGTLAAPPVHTDLQRLLAIADEVI
jgi:alkanesulfonate monooxygenase SsuD/methylene tetrahydromethanopterin reductase-like flavin-dependent oxidoreductase (luciferase family)